MSEAVTDDMTHVNDGKSYVEAILRWSKNDPYVEATRDANGRIAYIDHERKVVHHPAALQVSVDDNINSPGHYKWLPVEAIEITEHFNFVLGNVLKYVMRADRKGKPLEDLKKARWYLDREIQKRELASE